MNIFYINVDLGTNKEKIFFKSNQRSREKFKVKAANILKFIAKIKEAENKFFWISISKNIGLKNKSLFKCLGDISTTEINDHINAF